MLYVTEVLIIFKLRDDPEPFLQTPPLSVNSWVTRLAYSLLKNIVYIASVLSRPSFILEILQRVATQPSDGSQIINYNH